LTDTLSGLSDPETIDTSIPDVDSGGIDGYSKPGSPPRPPGFDTQFPDPPPDPDVLDVQPLEVDSPPPFEGRRPDVNLDFDKPDPVTDTKPVSPPLSTVVIPDSEDVDNLEIPLVPSLHEIIPKPIDPAEFPTFTATLDDAPTAPSPELAYTEQPYSSDLLDLLKARMEALAQGPSTGLSADVEQAIWDRGRAREDAIGVRKMQEVHRAFRSKGWMMPPGAEITGELDAAQEAIDKSSGFSRDVMIKQGELEQSNFQFSLQQAIQFESILLNNYNTGAQRALSAATATLQATIDLFEAVTGLFDAKTRAFVAHAQVFEQLVKAALAKLEEQRIYLEGQKLIGELNLQILEAYKVQLEGIQTVVSVYIAKMEGAKTQASVNETIVKQYGEEVEAFKSVHQAKAVEWDGYGKQVGAELGKAEIYKTDADAYSSIIDGYKAGTDARVQVKGMEIRINAELPLEEFKAKTEAFAAATQGIAEKLRGLAAVYDADARMYSADVQGEAADVAAQADVYRANTQLAVEGARLKIAAAQQTADYAIAQAGLAVEAAKATGTIAAQIAASAFSSVNLSAGIRAGDDVNRSLSQGWNVSTNLSSANSFSYSTIHKHNYDES
jgi:hypothetical protein